MNNEKQEINGILFFKEIPDGTTDIFGLTGTENINKKCRIHHTVYTVLSKYASGFWISDEYYYLLKLIQ